MAVLLARIGTQIAWSVGLQLVPSLFRVCHKGIRRVMAKSFVPELIKKGIRTIGTHDGRFHCDEVLGCAMLKRLFPKAKIIRSRDPAKLDACDIVIDVGGEYDPTRLRFDHHQKGFELTGGHLVPDKSNEWKVKLSSAGLIYCHFGRDILRCYSGTEDPVILDQLFNKMYEHFILEIDGIDNGIPMCSSPELYKICTGLSSRVGRLNGGWNQEKFNEEKAFEDAMELVDKEFEQVVRGYIDHWWPARQLVVDAISRRSDTDPSGEIIELAKPCPWTQHYFDIEAEMKLQPTVKHVVFKGEGETWRVQGVPVEKGSFLLRVPLRKDWQGLRGPVVGVDDAIFVHANGFIGGAGSRLGALKMARLSNQAQKQHLAS